MLYPFIFLIFLFGLIIGSFINCLIWRLHKNEGILGRSYCPRCRKQIAWRDNIPVLSFILLRGRCRHCKKKISRQYPTVELMTAVLFTTAAVVEFQPLLPSISIPMSYDLCLMTLRNWFVIAVMTIIFVYDLRWYLIPDRVTLPACAIVFALNLLVGYDWLNLVISGIIGGSFFLIQFMVSRGRWIGGGDIRLGLLMGLALGWPNVLLAIFLAYMIGSAISIFLVVAGKKGWKSQVPLGVFLTPATVFVLLWGSAVLGWYFGLLYI